MPKGSRGKGPEYRERLQYQFRFFIDSKVYKTAEEREGIPEKAKAHFIRTGEQLKGVRIEVRWRNPDNKNQRHAEWKSSSDPDQSLQGVWQSLGSSRRGRGALGRGKQVL